ncbi:phenylalanine--tRNA ligase subunit beta [uncultured Culturomica sp.]|uniref:phenylalanine--tRNA ligase subunit beta n=1 Tax=uncultured Culturomica sp. TaxID=1926654 RepID=UPI000338F0C6|nr:phenylalanine--tRNA ligase subunit beta [uncultured Culturomica sp.]CCZ06657.1 phenylalanine--tRNA ligase beta subunit [Odoribacter sp. CAG:788]
MKISLNWLKEYLKIDLDVEEICQILTSIGLEVAGYEQIESIKGGLKGLVIGEVKTCEAHPDSDHLHITTVDLGDGRLTPIVCGAPNVAAGQKVVVATIGTVLYDGDKEFVIKKSKIRGQESEGMICAEDEIGIGHDHKGIIVLPQSAATGMPAAEYYGITSDYAIEIDITPNRVDGASHLGVARDLAAYLKQSRDIDYSLPSVEAFAPDSNTAGLTIEVLRPEACPRYAGVCIEGVEVKESPEWLRTRLKAIGLNPINNIVDITNFILFELGQPLHSFDKDKVKGNKVVIRSFPTGTPFVTLDGIERKLDENDLMVCNAEEPMCIAGVFGGLESGITEQTTNVFLESACFDPVFVRKTARRHGINTDASFRFERGTDPNLVIYALKRAALLIKELAGGKITSDIIDIYPNPVQDFEVEVKYAHIDRLIGKQIGKENIKKILKSLEIKIVREDDEKLMLLIPPYRVDVRREADVIEDILRIYGFNNIEVPAKVNSTLSYSEKPDDYRLKNVIGDLLAANGFNEIMNNSLTKAAYFEGLETYKPENTVMLFNPLSSDLNAMRQSLLFGGLETIAYNINRKSHNLRLFEFGKVYTFHKKEGDNHLKQYQEENRLALFISGHKNTASWNSREVSSDFFTLKAYGEMVLSRLGLQSDYLTTEENNQDIFREGLDYSQNGKHLLSIGVVSSKLLKAFDIGQDVYYADFSWENILKTLKNHTITFRPLPKFPAVKRDLALLLDKKISFKEVKEIALRTEKHLLKNVSLFDVYEGEKLGADKKSYAVSFTLQDDEKTLTDKQIDKIMNKLIGTYKHLLQAEIR